MLALKVALRYLVSKKSHAAVNVISAISVAGVAVATAAIVVVLSVFNGFTDLAASHFSVIDPDLMVTPARGKTIADGDSLAVAIAGMEGVAAATPTLTERGLLVSGDSQLGVVFKGVAPGYTSVVDIAPAVVASGEIPSEAVDVPAASVAVGVANRLMLRPGTSAAELYVPKRVGRINPANPAGAFFSSPLVVARVFQVDQMEIDADHIIVPLSVARDLLAYETEATAVEIRTAPGADIDAVGRRVADALGTGFIVSDRRMQHAEAFRMISVEKWVTFAMLIFILIIAAFNIVSTLSLMVIEKRDNMATLRFLGATRPAVRAVFAWMGAIITLAGGIIGCLLGVALSLAQQWGGFIRLSGDPSRLSVAVYPVRVAFPDILAVLALVAVMAVLTSLVTRLFTRKIE